jgi:hypothetical protein
MYDTNPPCSTDNNAQTTQTDKWHRTVYFIPVPTLLQHADKPFCREGDLNNYSSMNILWHSLQDILHAIYRMAFKQYIHIMEPVSRKVGEIMTV